MYLQRSMPIAILQLQPTSYFRWQSDELLIIHRSKFRGKTFFENDTIRRITSLGLTSRVFYTNNVNSGPLPTISRLGDPKSSSEGTEAADLESIQGSQGS